ncbi:MAG: hypothetical protein ABI851_07830 [Saprospiraceae bacterium]
MKINKTKQINIMKNYKIFISLITIFLAACAVSKKSTKESKSDSSIENVSTLPAKDIFNLNTSSTTGIYAPGIKELAAIQTENKSIRMETLNKGYEIYSVGACINCHKTKSIYPYSEQTWKGIINDMAPRAALSSTDHDAVLNYVLAIKRVQKKGFK